jgi:biphenyl-2,3-diol 1,2-dioxygenase/3,4-dihydroxy-9,10-secoandrosta-1,3,5(10)-triene-9,17-dione 4,5-dioxygenase
MGTTAQLGYLGLEVSDLGAWGRFARELLGLAVGTPRPDGALPLRMDGHAHRFLLHEGAKDDVAYIGWELRDGAALDVLAGRLDRAGVPVQSGTNAELAARGVESLIWFEDPNAIRIEAFHGPAMGSAPFVSDRMRSGFHTGDQGMGHVLVNARSSAETERFYREVLGFTLTDYVDIAATRAVFLHVNPRHHSLAFAELPLAKRLHHVMLEVNEIDDVGTAFDRCRELGVPLQRTIGRHQNDRMVSFYGYTPSGFCFEVGWGGREIDDRTWEVKVYPGASDWGHRPVAPP